MGFQQVEGGGGSNQPQWREVEGAIHSGDQLNLIPHSTHSQQQSTPLTEPHPHLHTSLDYPPTSLNASFREDHIHLCSRPCRYHQLLGNTHCTNRSRARQQSWLPQLRTEDWCLTRPLPSIGRKPSALVSAVRGSERLRKDGGRTSKLACRL